MVILKIPVMERLSRFAQNIEPIVGETVNKEIGEIMIVLRDNRISLSEAIDSLEHITTNEFSYNFAEFQAILAKLKKVKDAL